MDELLEHLLSDDEEQDAAVEVCVAAATASGAAVTSVPATWRGRLVGSAGRCRNRISRVRGIRALRRRCHHGRSVNVFAGVGRGDVDARITDERTECHGLDEGERQASVATVRAVWDILAAIVSLTLNLLAGIVSRPLILEMLARDWLGYSSLQDSSELSSELSEARFGSANSSELLFMGFRCTDRHALSYKPIKYGFWVSPIDMLFGCRRLRRSPVACPIPP